MSAMKLGALGLLLGAALTVPAMAASQKPTVTVEGISKGKAIPADYAFCVPADQGHVTMGPNKSPKISWSSSTRGTSGAKAATSSPT